MKRRDLRLVGIRTQNVASVVVCQLVPPVSLQFFVQLLGRYAYWVVMLRSSAYMKLLVPSRIGWSFVYMLKRVGERTLPCGRPSFVFSICFAHCSAPHRIFDQTAASG